jgi:hypothetical protein
MTGNASYIIEASETSINEGKAPDLSFYYSFTPQTYSLTLFGYYSFDKIINLNSYE